MRKAIVYYAGSPAGRLEETPDGYAFSYYPAYLVSPGSRSISATLPKRTEPHASRTLFPFFHGLLAEGVLKETQCRKLKLDENDHFGRLIKTAHCDTIGAVTVVEEPET
ncbi:MAG: phosphatidylinositol kinase [Verrucomicrobia bacterium]|nr:phosphatidylinositol kinase [Verrucomicrobiota bacterium]